MQTTYETIFILQPELTEEEVDTTVGTFEQVLRDQKAELRKTEKWGKKRLAYRVRKFWEGFYVLMEYDASGATVMELERRLRIHDNAIKWMSVRKDPRADAEEARRAARLAQTQRASGKSSDDGGDDDGGGREERGGWRDRESEGRPRKARAPRRHENENGDAGEEES
ncbi:MAG TPA: 30S ribosomal protein S6 [Candidatus Saccharimonadales bacterium]|nr:30S ribosomal protein S6 [Candidatus Saccharimonadales bacterium]